MPKPTLLLADDNYDAIQILAKLNPLASTYEISFTFSAESTLRIMSTLKFDYALLDLNFPDMPRQKFSAALLALPFRPKIILHTGLITPDIETLAAELHSPIVEKPALVQEIFDTLQTL